MTGRPPARRGVVARAVTAYRVLLARQRRLERWFERRYPRLYDARHAATGIGRAVWPLVGPVLMALVLLPIIAVLAALVAVLAPSIDLPSVDLPSVPLPDIEAPGWLAAIGDAIAAVVSVLGPAAKYAVLAGAAALGIRQTRNVRRKRLAAEQVGRSELLRRLAVTLGAVASSARAQGAATVQEASVREDGWTP